MYIADIHTHTHTHKHTHTHNDKKTAIYWAQGDDDPLSSSDSSQRASCTYHGTELLFCVCAVVVLRSWFVCAVVFWFVCVQ